MSQCDGERLKQGLEAKGIPRSELSMNAVFLYVPLNANAVLQNIWNDWLQTLFRRHLVSP